MKFEDEGLRRRGVPNEGQRRGGGTYGEDRGAVWGEGKWGRRGGGTVRQSEEGVMWEHGGGGGEDNKGRNKKRRGDRGTEREVPMEGEMNGGLEEGGERRVGGEKCRG